MIDKLQYVSIHKVFHDIASIPENVELFHLAAHNFLHNHPEIDYNGTVYSLCLDSDSWVKAAGLQI